MERSGAEQFALKGWASCVGLVRVVHGQYSPKVVGRDLPIFGRGSNRFLFLFLIPAQWTLFSTFTPRSKFG